MALLGLKEIIISGREVILKLADTAAKVYPFPAKNIAGLAVLVISFLLASWIINTLFKNKSNFLIKLLGTGALFYILWIW